MICVKKMITVAEIEDVNTRNRFTLMVDPSGEASKVVLSMQRHSNKKRAYNPPEVILTISDPEELDDLAGLVVEILAGAGYLSIRGEEEPDK